MAPGFHNKILHVDLTDRSWTIEEPGEAWFRRYGGGRSMIAQNLLKHVPAGADPFGPENVVVFAPGVVSGAPVPGAGRHSVGALSPLTGGFGEAEAGGFWGAELKRAGWDGIVVHGASDTPVYLWIKDDQVEIRDASPYWGKVTGDVEDGIREELDDKFIRVAQCGPAGENLVRYACVINDLHEAAGRTGLGAVMGSKKLKAVAVRGKTPVEIADPASLKGLAKWVATTLDQNHRGFTEYGTGAAMQGKSLEGGLPTNNYKLGAMATVGQVDAVAVANEVRIAMESCFACSVRCKKVVQVEQHEENAGVTKKGQPIAFDPEGRWSIDPRYGGPEYESLAALGPTVGVDDLIAVLKSNELANQYGMDTISLGTTIGWAMEAFAEGVLTGSLTGGVELNFGDGETLVRLVEMIAHREGVGDLLAEGSVRAADQIGGGQEFLTAVKGMELAMHDPRHMERMRVSYLLAPTGGDHMSQTGNKNGLRNQVGLCHFLGYDDDQSLELMRAVTGWDLTAEELVEIAHRGLTLARLFNLRQGFTRADDTLPPRFREAVQPPEGSNTPVLPGITQDQIDEIVTSYYLEQGWDSESGVPTEATLAELGIEAELVTA
jgi:aldehyde:ferredoxin oxidoreductase